MARMATTIRERAGRAILANVGRVERFAGLPSSIPAKEESLNFGDAPYGADAALAVDATGWSNLTMYENIAGNDLRPTDRIRFVERARIYYERDAYSKQAIRLHTTYCVGRGLSIKARDTKEVPPDQRVSPDGTPQISEETKALQKDADAFWEHPDNSYTFSPEAQSSYSDELNANGEIFYTLFPPDLNDPESDKITRVRAIDDCLQITDIIFDPEDNKVPWYYLRTWSVRGKVQKRLYPDYRLFLRDERDEEDNLVLPPIPDWPIALKQIEVETNVFIYHQKVNTIGKRGNSLLTPAMDWAKVMRRYLENRATINEAHAKFAWKRIIKGPASAVAAFGKRAASAVGISGIPIPSPAGSTLNVNSGVDWEQMGSQDGGKNAYSESRNFRLMFCAAVGFAEHYFADGSMGTRATSKEMERPTELQLVAYQTIIKGGYEIMFSFHLKAMGRDYDAHAIWVDAPQILEDDTASVIESVLSVIGVLPQFDIDEMIIRMLNAFGIDDPQDVLIKIRQRQAELYQQNLVLAYAQQGLDPESLGNVDMEDPAALKKLVTQQQSLLTMLTPAADPTKQPGVQKGPQFGQPGTKGGALVPRKPTPSKLRVTDPNKQ